MAKESMNTITRRHFLNASGQATLAALAAGHPQQLWPRDYANNKSKFKPTADTVILLWMAGGMAQTETFDPKAYTPFASGIESKRVLSTFRQIDTKVDNIKISEGLEGIASIMDRVALIRTYQAADLGFILHSRHQFHWHTGYEPPLSVAAPHIGAVIARTLGPRNTGVPAFIDIGQNLEIGSESDAVKAFHTAGFLGTEFGPFFISDPKDAAATVRPPAHMSRERFVRREKQFRRLLAASPMLREGSDYQRESALSSLDNAHRLLNSPAAKAFDLSLEPKASYDRYNVSRFGLGCLLARRMTEAGARFIEVTTGYIPFRGWDTHENGHERTIALKRDIDVPITQLVLDLERSGMLNRTLIVIASEFGRDLIVEGKPGIPTLDINLTQPAILTEPKHYGVHRHFTEASSVLLIGGGMKKGYLYGQTADERPCKVVNKPVRIADLHATIYRALGIPPDLAYEIEKRPFHITKDGKGKPISELFA